MLILIKDGREILHFSWTTTVLEKQHFKMWLDLIQQIDSLVKHLNQSSNKIQAAQQELTTQDKVFKDLSNMQTWKRQWDITFSTITIKDLKEHYVKISKFKDKD